MQGSLFREVISIIVFWGLHWGPPILGTAKENPVVGNPLASGGKELAVSKRVGFVSYRKQNRSARCAVSRRKLLVGAFHVATVSAVSVCQEKRAPSTKPWVS